MAWRSDFGVAASLRLAALLLALPMAACSTVGKPGGSSAPEGRAAGGGPPCVSRILGEYAAKDRGLDGKVPDKSAVVHVSMPANPEELRLLNAMAIVAVAAFSNGDADLPLDSAIVNLASEPEKTRVLPPLFPVARVKDAAPGTPEAALGKKWQTVYYFLPTRFLLEKGELAVRFAKKSDRLVLLKFPVAPAQMLMRDWPRRQEDPLSMPDADLVLKILAQNYCVGVKTSP